MLYSCVWLEETRSCHGGRAQTALYAGWTSKQMGAIYATLPQSCHPGPAIILLAWQEALAAGPHVSSDVGEEGLFCNRLSQMCTQNMRT